MKRIRTRNVLIVAALAAASLLVVHCVQGEKIPPKGSTVTVTANPATIPTGSSPECSAILGVATCGTAQIVATVNSEVGPTLPDQDVRFTTTAGLFFTGTLSNFTALPVNVPVRTDQFGNATVNLVTGNTTTVTARSGTASGTANITTVPGNLSQITLNIDTTTCPGTSQTVTSCSDSVCLVARALDTTGTTGVAGIIIAFNLQNNGSGMHVFKGNFIPPQPTTDVDGNAFTTFTPDSTCTTNCGGNQCSQAQVVASTQNGAFPSIPLTLSINIP
jgi:hypothetical protein